MTNVSEKIEYKENMFVLFMMMTKPNKYTLSIPLGISIITGTMPESNDVNYLMWVTLVSIVVIYSIVRLVDFMATYFKGKG